MLFYYLIPIALGVTVLTQGILNRQFGAEWGLSTAVLANATIFFVFSLGLFIAGKAWPQAVPEFLRFRDSQQDFQWYYVVPGICGFILVVGLPWALQNIGPSKTFILLIASQIISSLASDQWIFQQPVSAMKCAGGLMTIVGAAIVVFG